MSGFAVPFSSSPPSTPDKHHGQFTNSFQSNPSTTPAGPPPSSARSFTPVGPPPSSVFGSSQFGPDHTSPLRPKTGGLFASSGSTKPQPSFSFGTSTAPRTKDGTPARPVWMGKRGTAVPGSSPPPESPGSDGDDEDDSMDAEGDEEVVQQGFAASTVSNASIGSSLPDFGSSTKSQQQQSLADGTPRGTKRTRGGTSIQSQLGSSRREVRNKSAMPAIAKNFVNGDGPAAVDEPDELILATEDLVMEIYCTNDDISAENLELQRTLSSVSSELTNLWKGHELGISVHINNPDYIHSIGPDEQAPSIAKATFLSSLLLQLHHPPMTHKPFGSSSFKASHFGQSRALVQPVRMPKILLDWLNTFHDPYPNALVDLQAFHPNSTSHPTFWETIFIGLLRGRFLEVLRILKEANFAHAKSAKDDGHSDYGYSGVALQNVRLVVAEAVRVIEECPALRNGDWDVRGDDWRIWRLKASQAAIDLSNFAEGGDKTDTTMADSFNSFSAQNFGVSSLNSKGPNSFSHSSRRVRSKVPWTVYENLKVFYGLLQGGSEEILSFTQDWVEATIALTAWWDGNEDDLPLDRSLKATPSTDTDVYLRKLGHSFDWVTQSDAQETEGFQVSTIRSAEVGLACIFEGDLAPVVELLRGWSLMITAAVVEIGSVGGWLHLSSSGGDMMEIFDENDLMLLSYGQKKKSLSRDDILAEYAEGVFRRDKLNGNERNTGSMKPLISKHKFKSREGWEIGVEVLGRLDNPATASTTLASLLEMLPLNSAERVDMLLNLCNNLNMAGQARKIAEKYADTLSQTTKSYGPALMYYARARATKKLKSVLDLLIAHCILHSTAYPLISGLDPTLKSLISTPKETLADLARIDERAAEILAMYLSGYATLRRFYELRDATDEKLRERERKREAAKALLAVLASADDNIHGGLYDESRGAVVGVDGLLPLLGETLVFLGTERVLDQRQLFLVAKAVEDLEVMKGGRVWEICEDVLRSALQAADGGFAPGSPELRKSISNLTTSSSFSLLSAGTSEGGSMAGSGVLVGSSSGGKRSGNPFKRGWDWRDGVRAWGADGISGIDIVRLVRWGIAQQLAKDWVVG